MGKSFPPEDLLRLSAAERVILAQDIWDSVAAVPESLDLTEAEREELDRRLAAYHGDPSAGSPWTEVKKRILSSR